MPKTIAWDYDGVIHPYTKGWIGYVPDDEPPVEGVWGVLEGFRRAGYVQVIYSTRCDNTEGLEAVKAWLEKWNLAEFFSDVTCQKPKAIAYIDDRAVPFQNGDWDAVEVGVERLTAGRQSGEPQTGSWLVRDTDESYFRKYVAEERAARGEPVTGSTGDLIMRHPDDCEECKANPEIHAAVKKATEGVVPAIVEAMRPFFEDHVSEDLLVNIGMSAFMAGGDAMQRAFGGG